MILHAKNDNMVYFRYNTNKLLNDKGIKANYIITEDKYHFPHYTMEAISLFNEYKDKIKTFSNEEDKTAYLKTVNLHKMGELDDKVLEEAFSLVLKEN